MPKQGGKFVLSSAEEAQLQQLIRAQSTPQGLAQRARVVQLAAQGMGVRAIGGRVGMHYNQVAKWRRRYLRGGIGALQDEPRSGRKAISAGNCCARSSIKPPDHRKAGDDGLAARWLASLVSPRRPCSESGVKTKS